MPDRNRPLPGLPELGILLVLAALVLLPAALRAEFVNFDDPFFTAPGAFAGGLAQIWNPTETIANAYLPVSHTSLWIDFQIANGSASWARVHSLLLHAVTAFALARLLGRVGASRIAATSGAALFLVHPALVESAAWVSGRKDLLSGLFAILCLSAAWRTHAGDTRQRAWIFVWALLALYSKGTAVVLPLLAAPVLLRTPRRLGLWCALLAITVGAGLHHTWIAASEGTLVSGGLGERAGQVPGVFWHYLATTFWPTGLNVMYPEVATFEHFRATWLPGLLALVALGGAIVAFRRARPMLAAGLLLWALALAPFNTALPASASAAADRYLYLAVPGAVLALLGLGPRVGPLVAAAAAIPCAFLAHQRAADFDTSETLWTASLEQDRANAVALLNLAEDSLSRYPGDIERVEGLLREAQEHARYPQHKLRASFLLIGVTESTGRIEESVQHARSMVAAVDELPQTPALEGFRRDYLLQAARQARFGGDIELADHWIERALAIDPGDPDGLAFAASAILGGMIDADGRVPADEPGLDEVRALLDRADRSPRAEDVYFLPLARAELASATGEFMAAERFYREAIRRRPRFPEAHLGRAQVFLGRGIYKGAEDAVREAIALGVTDEKLRYLLGLALGGRGKLDEARRYYEAYLRGRPHDVAARKALAAVIAGQTMRDLQRLEPSRLAKIADRVLELDAENPKGFVIRGVALRHARDMQGALVLFERAREMLEGDADVDRLWVETLRDRGYQLLLAEERRGAAFDYFRRFLDEAPRIPLPTDAVQNLVFEEWRRQYEAGRDALLAEDLDGAEAALRRCLELQPRDGRPRMQLGFVLFKRGGESLEAALSEFQAHAVDQRARGADPSLSVLYEVRTLSRLDREEDALEVADAYLASPHAAAEATNVARLREARDGVARRLDR